MVIRETSSLLMAHRIYIYVVLVLKNSSQAKFKALDKLPLGDNYEGHPEAEKVPFQTKMNDNHIFINLSNPIRENEDAEGEEEEERKRIMEGCHKPDVRRAEPCG